MVDNLSVTMAPKDTTFQVRINSEIKKKVEEIYARTGMTLTDAERADREGWIDADDVRQ